jgi:membrane protein DedA with SNARE-associated domain
VVSRLLHPLLSLHGWEAYLLVGVLVFAEAAIMLGFVFPGETAAILGGVVAANGGVSIGAVVTLVVLCAIAGDSVGYFVGTRWGRPLLQLGPLRKRQKGIAWALLELSRRGAVAVFVARFSAFLRAVVPGLAGMSAMHYRTFLVGNAAGGLVWGVLYTLLGYFVGQRVEAATGVASYVVLGLIVAAIVVLVVRGRRHRRNEIGDAPPDADVDVGAGTDQSEDDEIGDESAAPGDSRP